MKLIELSGEYYEGAQALRRRIAELKSRIETEPMCEIDRLRMRRRICILTGMMRDSMAISRYLENYYGDEENAGEENEYVC